MSSKIYQLPIKPPTRLDVTAAEARSFLLHIRREIRNILATLGVHQSAARASRRRAKKLRLRNGRFDGPRIAALEVQAGEADSACIPLATALRECGEMLLSLAAPFDASTTFEQRCEMLEVNQVDRNVLSVSDGLLQIAGAHGLESSAFYGRARWRSGALHRAIDAAAVHFLVNTDEGNEFLPSIFESDSAPGPEVSATSRRLHLVPRNGGAAEDEV